MDFELTDEQKILQTTARNMAEKHFKAKAFTWDKRGEYPFENTAKDYHRHAQRQKSEPE